MNLGIIIPTYNRKKLLDQAIESCLQQRFVKQIEIKIIVVDDGSTDGTTEEMIRSRRLKKVQDYYQIENLYLLEIKNSERGAARNRGAAMAIDQLSCEYLLFLDADDCLDRSSISYFEVAIKMQPLAELIAAKYMLWFGERVFGKVFPQQFPQNQKIKEKVLTKDFLALGAALVKASAFKDIGGFEENRKLSGSEDRVFLMTLAFRNKVSFSSHICTWYRQHDENTNLEKFLTSMELAQSILKPKIHKYYKNSQYAETKLRRHLSMQLIGAHNSNLQQGRPLLRWFSLIKSDPMASLNLRMWRLFVSIVYRQIFKKLCLGSFLNYKAKNT